MSAPRLHVARVGPMVTVQDAGRPHMMRFGVPASGPMDRLAFAAANTALGNPAGAPAIEVSLGGLSVACDGGRLPFALAGGGFIADHAGRLGGSWQVGTLEPGETLTIRPGPWGSWCYLALPGGVAANRWLGSAATHAASGLGGGRVTASGVLEPAGTPAALKAGPITCPITCPVSARPRPQVHVTMGPQDRFFDSSAMTLLREGPWHMTSAWDRMGVRLEGPALVPTAPLDMPSGPVTRGAIQVAGDGVATILLADHQTTGGYPRIATVLDCDLDALMQLRPRDRLSFAPVSPEQAVLIARRAAKGAARYLAGLTPA
jgi:allophanate hydrolase